MIQQQQRQRQRRRGLEVVVEAACLVAWRAVYTLIPHPPSPRFRRAIIIALIRIAPHAKRSPEIKRVKQTNHKLVGCRSKGSTSK